MTVTAITLDPPITPSRRADLASGARAMAPWLLGIVPFGLVIGVSAARADIPVVAGWMTAPLIFAGRRAVAVAVGATLGAGVPAGLQLQMVIPLFLVGEVVHRLRDRATLLAAAVAVIVAVTATTAPLHLGSIAAIGAGVVAGLYAERAQRK